MPMILLMAVVLASLAVAGISTVHSAPVIVPMSKTEAIAGIFSWPEIIAGVIAGVLIVIIIIRLWRKICVLAASRNTSDRDRLR